ncbi:D-alanyl-D-alanine carboxypeptidase family protein [Amycolatopsis sp.]|uniref:D-alanyl-D-alanine carboxypeptidase family protein n=1 Tax=Amycolatopsis sp. TaxID=37632 RepID=UPI002C555003|nr:D-alanyl-D-alanine carboxypeptidase family protein [Amycolatopsis sp.]HVV14517.1 D-alanyl-D-alanine carboxypeptidase family protein [Amycolatopsis sp.]
MRCLREHGYRLLTRALALLLLPFACLAAPGAARLAACRWALAVRFPRENLAGLTPGALAAFEAARARALWRDGVVIGLTSGHRSAAEQARLFAAEAGRGGQPRTLPPAESRHVTGTAMDVRPTEGARWLELHGSSYGLYRRYDNEWWHFEYCPMGPPERLPHPGARLSTVVTAAPG